MSGFDQGAWDAIRRLQNAKALDVECRRVLEFLLPRLGLSMSRRSVVSQPDKSANAANRQTTLVGDEDEAVADQRAEAGRRGKAAGPLSNRIAA